MGDEVRITVIATGFGSLDRAREPIRPVERETERLDARRTGVVRELPKEGGRRVVRLGTIEDGENPRFVPRGENEGEQAGGAGEADSQYDIPTFLRKQAD